jgi:mRNA interferase HigB
MEVLIKHKFEDAADRYPNDRSGLERCLRLLLAATPKSYNVFGAAPRLTQLPTQDCPISKPAKNQHRQ